MFGIANSLEILLEDMVVAIAKHRMIDTQDIKGWYWEKLLRVYRQIGRSIWDDYVNEITKFEIGAARAISAVMSGKKSEPMPSYPNDADMFTEKKKKILSPMWAKYHKANNIPIPKGYSVSEE